ncbi:MAG: ABC transporter permease, partial [Actinomycetales bacterium]
AYTSLAIGTGFERRSGALEFLGTTPLTRLDLLVGKLVATLSLTAVSMGVIMIIGLWLGWRPSASWPAVVVVAALGCCAIGSWAITMAGLLRAEAVLALANGIFVLLVVFGGVLIPADRMPEPLGTIVLLLPSGALTDGLQATLTEYRWPWPSLAILAAWAVVGALGARRTFRWSA